MTVTPSEEETAIIKNKNTTLAIIDFFMPNAPVNKYLVVLIDLLDIHSEEYQSHVHHRT
jgi:hypothetical protein